MFLTGFADEAGWELSTQIKATKELGWKYIESRGINKKNLATKLYRAGFGRDTVSAVTAEMEGLGYIDERRQLERIILNEANLKLRGPRKIIPTLAAKGYSTSDISSVMSALVDSGEIDFSRNARILAEKKLPDDADSEEKKKLLYKNGYKI